MSVLAFGVSLLVAAVLAPVLLASLRRWRVTAPNHRGRRLPRPTGLVLALAPPLALAVLATVDPGGPATPPAATLAAVTYVGGVCLLGLVDDLAGGGAGGPRGVRGHVVHAARGRPSTGLAKAVGTAGLAVWAVSAPGSALAGAGGGETVLAVASLTLAPHVFNLLDTRPGRSLKALGVLGAGLFIAAGDAEAPSSLGVLLAPLLVLLPLDLRERGMLGDTGASAVGAIAGLWVVLALAPAAQAVALAAGAAIALYGELRSITALVERNPLLRQLDSLGRCR